MKRFLIFFTFSDNFHSFSMNLFHQPKEQLIAPCGMNCGICLAFLRTKNNCPGCRSGAAGQPNYCRRCIILNCEKLEKTSSKFCYECDTFPCKRLKQLDKRYRTKYRMSMLENLAEIRELGLEYFIKSQEEKWHCPACGGSLCVHRGFCLKCYDKKSAIH